MPHVELTSEEWQQVINILATAPWREANPLLMRLGDQLRQQAPTPTKLGDGKEIRHE